MENMYVIALFLFFGIICFFASFFVLLIHIKYADLRKNMYAIIMACLIFECFLSFDFIIIGIDGLFSFQWASNDLFCTLNSVFLDMSITSLHSYNVLTIISLFRNDLPAAGLVIKRSDSGLNYWFELEKAGFGYVHIISLLIGSVHPVVLYLTNNCGRGYFDVCFVQKEANGWIFGLMAIISVYFIFSIAYAIVNCKKKYYSHYPCLKWYSVYNILTSSGWMMMPLSFFFHGDNLEILEAYTPFIIAGPFFSLVVSVYYRFSCSYIQNILKEGESNNKFIQAILILFCLETKADMESYEGRARIKYRSLYRPSISSK